jgi:crotonobetainyl-CoA:carnitine CoA-transferase CaiB-like acyl-CoA transferase
MSNAKDSMLAPYLVLDLTTSSGYFCGRLLGDLGADVIKIEPPGGDPGRNIGPFYHDIPDPEKSLNWFMYNANKRGITLNIETEDGKAIFKQLVKKADFIIESFPVGYMDSVGLGYKIIKEINPQIIMTSISPFGQEGPWSKYKGSDIVNFALSSWMYQCGDRDRPPVRTNPPQSNLHGSAQAAVATLAAHYNRTMTGKGQYIDASCHIWMNYCSSAPYRWAASKVNEDRQGQLWSWAGRPTVRYVWECKDGFLCFSIMGSARFGKTQKALVEWMELEGKANDFLRQIDWESLDYGSVTQEFRNNFEEPIAAFFKDKTKDEIIEEGSKRGVVVYASNSARDLLEYPQLQSRNYWIELSHPELEDKITYPGPFFKSSEVSWQMKRRAPLIGEHNEEIYIDLLGVTKEELLLLKTNNIV